MEHIDYIIDYYEKVDDSELAADIVIMLKEAEELIFLHQTGGLNVEGNVICSDAEKQTGDRTTF
jgi:hypothetical protein